MTQQKKKIGFVFAGGGSRGSIQVGMVRRVMEQGILPDIVTGVSIGACNAFFVAQHEIDRLEQLWRSIQGNDDVYRKRWFAACLMYFGLQWGMPSLFKPGPLAKKFSKIMKKTPAKAFKSELRIGAVDLVSGNYVSVNQDHPMLSRFIVGATAIPLVLPAVRIKKREDPELAGVYVDGAIRNLTPIGEAIRLGADEVHIFLTGSAQLHERTGSYRVWSDHIERTIDIGLHELFVRDIDNILVRNRLAKLLDEQPVELTGDTHIERIGHFGEASNPRRKQYRHVDLCVYEPQDGRLQGLLDFDPTAIKDAIKMGYHVAASPIKNKDLHNWISDDKNMPYGHYYVDFQNNKHEPHIT